ncbi:MAG: hypothetical protein H0U49_01065 [Parachlamydiaceae bacterium]|nr:hypothetical protein [Parachlamydiaceae bacterium]
MKQYSFLSFFRQRVPKLCLLIILAIGFLYGSGRLYYRLTDGFLESNIVYDMGIDPQWNTVPLTEEAKIKLNTILSQPFYYLGKGCQSYVFASEDGLYVIKFVKYQRFRPPEWLDSFATIPFVSDYRLRKIAKKKKKLDNVFASWKLAYEELQPETGVVYVHFNKTDEVDQKLVAYDKLGFKHELQLKDIEFMLQKKIDMLCPTILKLKEKRDLAASKSLIDRLFAMLLSEYERGLADNDHALMQNTGVDQGQPIHIDVGQFVKNSFVSDPSVHNQELFNKTWKFRKWLEKNDPQLADYTEQTLKRIIGQQFDEMHPIIDKSSMGRIQNQG